ncbi:iron export ABC transporter permease subunit FetB [Dulcicalothrix desertica PCC 7102]|uniref:Iron export ABC transporter permease subunit FetB n=1 Tax=Dulcicalothrix desertica PCC 7102 TaxID=232991 RepID=A0A433UZC6_9CYAN|nr:iron export ABC transporter permease subunit FetB [Dulcicalothrix desertica]RUS99171.1 iron export ABC transporter permease subunit FetB [Dulcicalothrix desertica PCC 7102]TWH61024.1 putative ABC transport system permease protein [Dulcicalothrix desertica PCC 7102]
MPEIIKLDFTDLGIAVALMAITIGLSAWEKLGIEIKLLMATGRTILQLMVLGYVLDFIFAVDNVIAVLAILAVIITIAAIITRNRISQKIPLVLPLVWGAMFISTSVSIIYTNYLIIQPQRWFEPRYVIPLALMVIAGAMNAAAIAGERLVKTIDSSHLEIETHLSLGATPTQAVAQYRKEAIRAGIIPTINQMTLVGMVTIPSFFTGQLLAGVKADEAISYQIVVLFMIAFANLVTTILITRGLSRQFFNEHAQLIR